MMRTRSREDAKTFGFTRRRGDAEITLGRASGPSLQPCVKNRTMLKAAAAAKQPNPSAPPRLRANHPFLRVFAPSREPILLTPSPEQPA
jgi:hypothetical protein